MKSRCLFLLAGFIFSFTAMAQNYAVGLIPKDLLKNANAVKRMEVIRTEVVSMTKMKQYRTYAITILNEAGDKYAGFFEFYDKLRSVQSVEGRLYDFTGKKIKTLKKSDIKDESAVSDISLIDDGRVKSHNFYHKVYPYTVEYELNIELNNTYIFKTWVPQYYTLYAVESSVYQLVCPADFGFRYKAFNYEGEPQVSDEKSKKSYTWSVKNMQARFSEYAAPEVVTLTTCLYISPDKFELEGYKGSMATWEELGKFQLQLNKGRDKLPEAIKQKVQQLTAGLSDPKDKIRVLYEYMQQNTRYISIQLGIGGLQPFDASFVANKAYGDCKALTNYMYSLLKEVNIRSHYTLIKAMAGQHFFMPDFPSDQFDHIILCVPLQKDTVWLECTSQTIPAGYLGDHTDNRHALLVDEEGGKLVRTPKYGLNDNLQIRKINAKLEDGGTLLIRASSQYTGLQQDNLHGLINNVSKERVKEYLNQQLDFPTYDIRQFEYLEDKAILPAIHESLEIMVSSYATVTGKRLFITPNIMTRSNRKLIPTEERKYDIVFKVEYKDVDSVEIELPKGYQPESMPAAVSISSPFGKYNCSVKLDGNKLFYYRSIEQYSGRFPAKDYAELVKYYDAIYKADRNRVVLVRDEQPLKAF